MRSNRFDTYVESSDPQPTESSALIKRTRGPMVGVMALLATATGLTIWTVQRLIDEGAERPLPTSVAPAPARPKDVAAPAPVAGASVAVTRPVALRLQPVVQIEGSLAPKQTTSLAFSVPGTLSRLSVRVGDEVKVGARLAQLDASAAAAQFAMTGASVKAATAQLTLAVDHAARSSELAALGTVNAASAIDSQLQSSVVAAELEAARAQHAQAQITLNEHTLRAPFSGTVVAAPEAVGAVVSPGVPLFRLADLRTLKLNATLNESEAKLLRVGAKVTIDSASGPVEGRITRLLDTLDEHTRRVPVEAELSAPGPLRAGAFVRAQAQAVEPLSALRVPGDVLRPGSSHEVFVVVPGYSATLAVRRVQHEVEPSGTLLIHDGLRVEDVVVRSPAPGAKEGDTVIIAGGSSITREAR